VSPNVLDSNLVVLALAMQELRISLVEVTEDVLSPIVQTMQRGLERMGLA
jgi:hypothetical protein